MRKLTTLLSIVLAVTCNGEIFTTPPFTPTSVSGLALWLDGSDTNTMYDSAVGGSLSTNNGVVGRWEDKSGNGNNATNSSALSPIKTNVIGYGTSVLFNGSNRRLIMKNDVVVTNSTMFFVYNRITSTRNIIVGSLTSSTCPMEWWNVDNRTYIIAGGSVRYFTDTRAGNFVDCIMIPSTNATYATLFRSGVQNLNWSGGGYSSGYSVNAVGYGDSSHSGNYISDIIIYNQVLSDTERKKVEDYLSAKWSIPLNGKVSSEDYPVQPAIVVTTAQSQPVVDDASLTNGLVLWYKMDEAKWLGTAGEVQDSASTNNGTVTGGATTNPGKLGRAGYFDGVSSRVRSLTSGAGDYTNNFSATMWIKTTRTSDQRILVKRGSTTQYDFYLGASGTRLYLYNGVSSYYTTTPLVTEGEWHNVGFLIKDNYLYIIRDGILFTTGHLVPIVSRAELLGVGSFPNTATSPFFGSIDDVRIYNRALTSNEVSRLYAMTSVDHKANAVYQGNKLVSNATKLSYLSETPNYANSIVFKTAGYSNTWTAPYITASTLNNSDVSWRRLSDGAVTYTKTPSMTFFNKTNDTYWVTSSDWSKVTAFSFSSSSGIKPFLFSIYTSMLSPRLTGLSTIRFDFQGLDVDYQVEPLPISLSGTGLEYTWQYCTGSKNSFPCISNLINVISLRNTWGACYGNTNEFPYVNSLTNVISLREAWYNCYGIKNGFPAVSNLVKITTLENAWKACYGNTNEFPYVNSLTNVTGSGLVGTWQDCSGIKNRFPAVSNLTNVTSLVNTWASCYGNTNEFPYVNSLTNVVSLVSAWGTCQGIKNGFPAVSNLVKVTTIASAWSGCTGNTNEFPYVNSLTNISAGGLASAWYNCNSIKNGFPDVSNLVKVNDLSRTWAYCRNLTNGLPYINSLTNTLVMFQTYFEVSEYRLDFPEVSALTKVFSLGNTWYGCRTSSCFPSVTTLTNVAGNLQYTAMDATWYDCRAMTNNIAQLVQPLSYFSSGKCKYFGKTFYNCYNLKGSAMPYITAIQSAPSYPTGYTTTQMFYNCTNLTDYASIPAGFK